MDYGTAGTAENRAVTLKMRDQNSPTPCFLTLGGHEDFLGSLRKWPR